MLDQDTSVVKDSTQFLDDESIYVKDELECVIDLTQHSQQDDPFVTENNGSAVMAAL